MSKYEPKTYQLLLFNELGSKIKTIQHVNFLTADNDGKEYKMESGGSFVIMQVLKNSEIAHDIHDFEQWKKRIQ